ncbi:MAG TPA: phage baseplate assembly protein V [Ruminiclostridium sp.]|nr:phage baseplate assembly protein V [Ruminiclostridium sp.]
MSEDISISNFTEFIKKDEKVFGVMIGLVIKNDSANDSEKPGPGLVKVQIPLLGMKESNWARVVSFMAGKERGAFFIPEVGDEVLVAFENGDVNKPFVIGALWNGKDTPPEKNSDGKNDIRIIKSRSGNIIQFSDKSGSEKISISSTKDIEISAPNGKLSISAKEVEIKSTSTAKIEASSDMTIKGSTVNIN